MQKTILSILFILLTLTACDADIKACTEANNGLSEETCRHLIAR